MQRNDPKNKIQHHVNVADNISCDIERSRAGQPLAGLQLGHLFINVFLDFDFTYRVLRNDNEFANYYAISEEGLHITYPAGLQVIAKHVSPRLYFGQYLDCEIPQSAPHWVQELGKERLLIADYSNVQSPDPKFIESGKYINELVIIPNGDEREAYTQKFVTISRAHVSFQELQSEQLVVTRNPSARIKADPYQKPLQTDPNQYDLDIEARDDEISTQAHNNDDVVSTEQVQPAPRKTTQAKPQNKPHSETTPKQQPKQQAKQKPSATDKPSAQVDNSSSDKSRRSAEPPAKKNQAQPTATSKANKPKTKQSKPKQAETAPGIDLTKQAPPKREVVAIDDDLSKMMQGLESFIVSPEECRNTDPATGNTAPETHVDDTSIYAQHKINHIHQLAHNSDVLTDTPLIMLWLTLVYRTYLTQKDLAHSDFGIHSKSQHVMVFEPSFTKEHLPPLLSDMIEGDAEQISAMAKTITRLLSQKHIRAELFIQQKEKGFTRFKPRVSKAFKQEIKEHSA
jgi:hypothetical protein